MKENHYISLIVKSISGEITKDEQVDLTKWLEASDENQSQFEKYRKIWDNSGAENSFEPDVDLAFERFNQKVDKIELASSGASSKKGRIVNWNFLKGIAATFIIVLGCIYFFTKKEELQNDQVITFSKVDRRNKLPDGSSVWMNKGSEIKYNSEFEERTIDLVGEAYFEIKKDPAKPFSIHCEKSIIKVLGTSFNVRSIKGEKEVEVVVSTGKVEVSSTITSEKAIIVHGQKAIVNLNDGSINVIEYREFNAISWKKDVLIFDNETLEVIAKDISNHFHIKMEVSESIKQCHFTMTFENPNLDEILELFANYFSIQKSENGKVIQINGDSCD